jgi:maltooligosyltrehalose trehalohydrolase
VYRALSALLLMAPQTPLLFMGQEWAATAPFLFFTDHHDELGRLITEGRRGEFAAFAAFRDPLHRASIPDPQASNTFERSRLAWDERERAPHVMVHRLYERLIAIRRTLAHARRGVYRVDVLDEHTIALRQTDRLGSPVLLIARLSGGAADIAAPLDAPAHILFTTEDHDVTVDPSPIHVDVCTPIRLRFSRPGAIVLGSPLAI